MAFPNQSDAHHQHISNLVASARYRAKSLSGKLLEPPLVTCIG